MRNVWLLLVVMGCATDNPITSPAVVPPIQGVDTASTVPKDTTTPYRHPGFIRNPSWNESNVGMTLYYESRNWAKPWSFFEVTDTTEAIRAGWKAQRFEVRSGDCYSTDCTRQPTYERSEYAQAGWENVEGDEYWYGWSLYVPGNIGSGRSVYYGQFQQHSNWNPIWMFLKVSNGPFCVIFDGAANAWQCTYTLIDHANFAGRWHDIVVHAKWTVNNDGFTRIYVNGELKVNYTGYTRTAPNDGVYFKYGIYRVSAPTTSIAYYDEIRRGKTREEVDIQYLLSK